MLGLFDVNIPLLYGEGEKAFMRLQLEIIRKSDDDSIFAWELESYEELNGHPKENGMLASRPSRFKSSRYVEKFGSHQEQTYGYPYTMTNRGLCFETDEGKETCSVSDPGSGKLELYWQLSCVVRWPPGQSGSPRRIEVSLEQGATVQGRYWKRRDCFWERPSWLMN